MGADGTDSGRMRTVVYCLIPADLAAKLHEPLRRHFREADPAVEVIVEQRKSDRRRGDERRSATAAEPPEERRRVRAPAGRRVGERRTPALSVATPSLPRRARPHAQRIAFAERLEPSDRQTEDVDSARLVAAFQAGDREAFGTLYERYFQRVYTYMRLVFNESHEAEDGTQEVFVKVYEALPRYERRPGRPFRGWLFTIVRNHALNQLERARRLEVVEPEEINRRWERESSDEAELSALDWITDRDLMLFIERLPRSQQQVLLLRYMLDLTPAEIAEILDRTAIDVRRLQHRALRFLESRLRAIGRESVRGEKIRMRRFAKQAQVLRRRRTALLG